MLKTNNLKSFYDLREKYPLFTYDSYTYSLINNQLRIQFIFTLGTDIVFKPQVTVKLPIVAPNRDIYTDLIENIIFHIGLIELISYWKAACSPSILIKAGSLNDQQINWWKELYYNGLGEFFFLNSITVNQDEFVDITSHGVNHTANHTATFIDEYIVPIGGGKDSAVTLALLMQNKLRVHPLIMNPRGATIHTVEAAGLTMKDVNVIERTIDPMLLKLNDQGFLNGHTPFSAMLAFYTLLASALTGYQHIALSNESSANEPTIPGTHINHQYSKSVHFENNFRGYYKTYISNAINYFSFLRPLDELQIASIFSRLDEYHHIFRSCNVGSKNNTWCASCSKCLFTFIMLAAFRGVEYATAIIGDNMLDNPSNTDYFDELCGFSPNKPFECVGTIKDVQTAMQMIVHGLAPDKMPLLARRYGSLYNSETSMDQAKQDTMHFLNPTQLSILNKALI